MSDPSNNQDSRMVHAENRLKDQGQLDNFGSFLDDEETDSITNAEAVYQHGLRYFLECGYKLVPSPQGVAANHNVYKLEEPPKIKGLNLPENYKTWQPIYHGSAYNLFLSVVQGFISEDPEQNKLWTPLTSPISNKNSTLYAIATNKLQAQSQEQVQFVGRPIELGIEPNPTIPKVGHNISEIAPRAFIPDKNWFAPQLHQVTLDDLFTIFPPIERELFSLILGRAIVGRNNSLTPSGDLIKHTARMAAIVCGPAGLGKSTLFEAIWSAVSWAGYNKKTIKNIDGRFNIGKIAVADIIYKDDTSQKEIRKLFESATAKTIITSNDVLMVEDKGQDAYEIIPVGTMFMNANEFNPRDSFSMDPGMADRIKMLSTISQSEASQLSSPNKPQKLKLGKLAEESPDALPWHHLDWLCDKLEVSKLALMLWGLRLCADKFLELIQPSLDHAGKPINLLANKVKMLSLQLRTTLYKEVTEQILSAALIASLTAGLDETSIFATGEATKRYYPPSSWITFSKSSQMIQLFHEARTTQARISLLHFLKWHFTYVEPDWSFHPYLGFTHVDAFFTTKAYQEASDMVSLEGRREFDKTLHFFKTIRASNGVEVSADPVWLFQAADTVQTMFPRFIELNDLYNTLVTKKIKVIINDELSGGNRELAPPTVTEALFKRAQKIVQDEDYHEDFSKQTILNLGKALENYQNQTETND